MIELHNISKRFGRFTALDDVTLRVDVGQAVALWGPNGAGKTTLIRCILGLIPFKGTASIDGLDVSRQGRAARRLLGYVPQEPAIDGDMRVREAVAFFARLRRADRDACKRAIERAELTAHARKRVRELSGGMRQRLSLEIALLTDPPVLILDEPTASLDDAARKALLRRLANLREDNKTIMFTSHRPEEIEDVADQVVMMENGKIIRIAPPARSATTTASSAHVQQHAQRPPSDHTNAAPTRTPPAETEPSAPKTTIRTGKGARGHLGATP